MVQECKSPPKASVILVQLLVQSLSVKLTLRRRLLVGYLLLTNCRKLPAHAAFSGFIHYLQNRWTYYIRTIPEIQKDLQPLEDAIRQRLMPALFGKELTDLERKVVALPARFGGLGMQDPTEISERAFTNSRQLTAPLVALLLAQSSSTVEFKPKALKQKQKSIRSSQMHEADNLYKQQLKNILDQIPKKDDFRLAIELAGEKRASTWLTARPTQAHETVLHKRDFRDALRLRYAWKFPDLPEFCGCGKNFSMQHALTCLKGGFRSMGHDEVRDVYAGFMQAAGFKYVVSEPELQPLTGELLQVQDSQQEGRREERSLGDWFLDAAATRFFRLRKLFTLRAKLP